MSNDKNTNESAGGVPMVSQYSDDADRLLAAGDNIGALCAYVKLAGGTVTLYGRPTSPTELRAAAQNLAADRMACELLEEAATLCAARASDWAHARTVTFGVEHIPNLWDYPFSRSAIDMAGTMFGDVMSMDLETEEVWAECEALLREQLAHATAARPGR